MRLHQYCWFKTIDVLGESHTPEHWKNAVSHVEHVMLYMEQLDRVAYSLSAEVLKVALKNSGIARGLHTNLACTPMGDVDVLVSLRILLTLIVFTGSWISTW